ncbi:MAG: porin, partial [Burkholderiales bacterium PBB5]
GVANGANLYTASNAALGSGATTAVRANNMVGYFLPSNLGGVYGSVQVAAGEGVVGNKYMGFRVGYAAGPVDASLGFSNTTVAGSDKYKTFNIGGSYNLGVAKLYGFYDQRKFGALKYTTYELSAGVPLGQGEFRAAYSKGNSAGTGIDKNDATLMGVEYIYNLSKRTALYTQYGRLSNKGASALTIGAGGAYTAADLAKDGGRTSAGYGVGVRHSF